MAALKIYLRLPAVMVLFLLIGCGGGNPAPTNPGGSPAPTNPGTPPGTTPPAPSTDLLTATPDVKVNSADHLALYKDGLPAFTKKYAGKVFDVTDVVTGYDYVSIKDGTAKLEMKTGGSYKCLDPHPMTKAMPGQTVTLRGRCVEGNGILAWAIVKVEGDSPPTISAEELVKEFMTDAGAATKKYRDKWLIVTGTIQKVEAKDALRIILTKPGEKPEVNCLVLSSDATLKADPPGGLKEGQTVRVLGQSLLGDPALSFGVVLPEKK